jgi:hypothetical protein
MRKALFVVCILCIPCASWARDKQASWQNLNALRAGEKIQVAEMSSKTVTGTLLNVSGAAISVQEKGGPQTIQMQDVRSVKLSKHTNRFRNTLIGAGLGLGIGAGIGAAAYKQPQTCIGYCGRGGDAASGAVIGLVAGAVIGALVPDHKTLYRVKAHL